MEIVKISCCSYCSSHFLYSCIRHPKWAACYWLCVAQIPKVSHWLSLPENVTFSNVRFDFFFGSFQIKRWPWASFNLRSAYSGMFRVRSFTVLWSIQHVSYGKQYVVHRAHAHYMIQMHSDTSSSVCSFFHWSLFSLYLLIGAKRISKSHCSLSNPFDFLLQ